MTIFREVDGAETAVVFIHGFMGGPNQFDDLADAVLQSGCSCVSLLLPGHGARMRDLAASGARDWAACVQGALDGIRHRYRNIFLVGHSMGGLLALNASLNRENHVSGVLLIATPLKLHLLHPRSLMQKFRLLTLPHGDAIRSAYQSANSITARPMDYPLILKPILQFLRLMRETEKRLPEVFVPVWMVHSKNDETTAYASAGRLYDSLCHAERFTFALDRSWHAFYVPEERAIIRAIMLEALSRFQKA